MTPPTVLDRCPDQGPAQTRSQRKLGAPPTQTGSRRQLGLYKIFVYFEAVLHESTILSFPPPTCISHPGAIQPHDYWTIYDSPSNLPFVYYTPCNIGNNNIVYRARNSAE